MKALKLILIILLQRVHLNTEQGHSQDFTLGEVRGGKEAECGSIGEPGFSLQRCTFSLKKTDDLFSRCPQNFSYPSEVHIFDIFEGHRTLLVVAP